MGGMLIGAELGNVMRFMVRMTTIMDTFVIEKILICSLYCPGPLLGWIGLWLILSWIEVDSTAMSSHCKT